MRIDAHQHFWQYNPVKYAWIDESMGVLKRDFLPPDLQPLLEQHQIDGCVAVQADQSEEETRFLLDLSDQYDFIKSVVGWVDLKADNLDERLIFYKTAPKLKGFRHVLQAEPPGFMTDPLFVKGVQTLADYGFTYDILIFHHQLEEALQLVAQLPEMKLVIDHIAKPDIKNGERSEWEKWMRKMSKIEHVSVKISGMATEADWVNWKIDDFQFYINTTLEAFGTERVMFGSDWPVCLLAARYNQVVEIVERNLPDLNETERARLFGLNAATFYDLK